MSSPIEETVTINGCMVINETPAASAEQVIERLGLHEAQVVYNAKGDEAHLLADLLKDVWFQATWHAFVTPPSRTAAWLAGDR